LLEEKKGGEARISSTKEKEKRKGGGLQRKKWKEKGRVFLLTLREKYTFLQLARRKKRGSEKVRIS